MCARARARVCVCVCVCVCARARARANVYVCVLSPSPPLLPPSSSYFSSSTPCVMSHTDDLRNVDISSSGDPVNTVCYEPYG